MAICIVIAILALVQMGLYEGFTWAAVAILVGLIHLALPEGNGILYVEHAVLNFFNGAWYIEDISSKNGVSIRKSDGKKYKISYGKPCSDRI